MIFSETGLFGEETFAIDKMMGEDGDVLQDGARWPHRRL
jgi:hypothetical protein